MGKPLAQRGLTFRSLLYKAHEKSGNTCKYTTITEVVLELFTTANYMYIVLPACHIVTSCREVENLSNGIMARRKRKSSSISSIILSQ